VGDAVNLESDIMMRYAAQAVENRNRLAGSEITTVANPRDPLLEANAPLIDLVEAVRALPYGRPSDRSVDGLLRERRGTCSTKHLFPASTAPSARRSASVTETRSQPLSRMTVWLMSIGTC